MSDEGVEGEWRWVAGPEAGQPFWLGKADGTASNFQSWGRGEPNDYRDGEDSGTIEFGYLLGQPIGMISAAMCGYFIYRRILADPRAVDLRHRGVMPRRLGVRSPSSPAVLIATALLPPASLRRPRGVPWRIAAWPWRGVVGIGGIASCEISDWASSYWAALFLFVGGERTSGSLMRTPSNTFRNRDRH